MNGRKIRFVESASARHVLALETGSNVDAINRPHSDMVKFHRGSEIYRRVRARLKLWVEAENHSANTIRAGVCPSNELGGVLCLEMEAAPRGDDSGTGTALSTATVLTSQPS